MELCEYRFGSFFIDTRRRVLEQAGEWVDLPRKCTELLLTLLAEPKRLFTKDELLDRLWPDAEVEENNLARAVSTLRGALGDRSSQPRWIETVARRGYRFVGQVHLPEQARQRPLQAPGLNATRLYLRGRHASNQMSAASYQEACAAFAAALDADPGMALAHEGLAYAKLQAAELWIPTAASLPDARRHAERALELDPTLGRAHGTLAAVALMYDRDRNAMRAHIDAALALEPDVASNLLNAAWLCALDGHAREAHALCGRAALVDDADLEFHLHSAGVDWATRRYAKALEHVACVRRMDPDHWLALAIGGRCHEAEGRLETALECYRLARELAPDAVEPLGDLGRVLGALGDASGARAALGELDAGRLPWVPAFVRAQVLQGLGELDGCFGQLQACIDERSWFASWLYTVPVLDPLRVDTRFHALRKRSRA